MRLSKLRWSLFVAAGCLSLTCNSNQRAQRGQPNAGDAAAIRELGAVPAKGSDSTLDIASWNVEWFGDASNGPTDEALQLKNVHTVITGADMDIWGFTEVVNSTSWDSLKSQLSGYAGLLASDATVIGGSDYYGSAEQKAGLLYKTSLATPLDARLILTGYDADFAGRPPLQVTLRVTLNEATEDIIVVVLHPKCCSGASDWQQRLAASSALKSYLDSAFPNQKLWVIGDFNDDVDTSTAAGYASPYANFVNDAAHYTFATKELSDARISSTVGYVDTIDHHLTTNESYATYLAGSAEVLRGDQYIDRYGTTTSDHFPVLSRYYWATGSGITNGVGGASGTGGSSGTIVSPGIIVNEICANEPGSDTAGEFIELVNTGTAPEDIGGWTLSDGSQVRHTFASDTTLDAGKAIVVFAGSSAIPSGLANAVIASTGGLSLANDGDSVALSNASGATVAAVTYTSSLANNDGVSMNLSPDGSLGGTFVKHTAISTLSQSAGKRADGSDW